jgi:hypothetical protein
MLFECPIGHKITRNFRDLEDGKGCKICLKLQKPTLEEVINYCYSIGFSCLSEKYENAHAKLELKCCNGHIFYCCLDKLKHNRGCPHCSSSKCEMMIKYIIESLMGEKFVKIRPDFLKFPKTNRNLELDMFNESLKLAFEYQGNQHYDIIPKFKMTAQNLSDYQERDAFKKKKCQNENIKLIDIPPLPYDKNKYDPQQIKKLVTQILIDNNLKFVDKTLLTQDIIRAGNTMSSTVVI